MSHTATGEWKSFEIRMRRRRAERCAARADIDLARGAFDEARVALQEARRLAPDLPQLADLEDSIQAAERAARISDHTRWRDASLYAAITVVLLTATAAGVWIARHPGAIAWRSVQRPVLQSSFAQDVGSTAAQPHPAPAARPETPAPRVIVDQEPIIVTEVSWRPAAAAVLEADATTEHASEPPPVRSAAPSERRYAGEVTAETLPSVAALPVEKVANPSPSTFARLDAQPIPTPPLRIPAAMNPDPGAAVATAGHSPLAANVPAESAVANAVAERSAAPPAAPHDDVLVQQTLNRYATAYTRLDAQAAQQVWPTVDRDALARAFGGLALQRVSLGDCRIDVEGAAARAACAGTETWAPKIGAHGPHTAARNWTFELTKAGTDWQIVSARVQNK